MFWSRVRSPAQVTFKKGTLLDTAKQITFGPYDTFIFHMTHSNTQKDQSSLVSYDVGSRVTGLGEFSPNGRLFALGSF
jgi:hypothetical protein